MRMNYFIKSIPLLWTIFIILFLNITNHNANTKLRILIWNTPSLSLGTYLAISNGAGFLLSYILTTNLASINSFKSNKSIKYQSTNESKDDYEDTFLNYSNTKEKILIERNINDPSPTINAQFRVIGKTQRDNHDFTNNTDSTQYENSETYYQDSYVDNKDNIENAKQSKEFTNDWSDDSFSTW